MSTPSSISITPKNFLERFTKPERIAIHASADVDVKDMLLLCIASERIVSTDPLLAQGMAYLVYLGLLTQARRDEIMDFGNQP